MGVAPCLVMAELQFLPGTQRHQLILQGQTVMEIGTRDVLAMCFGWSEWGCWGRHVRGSDPWCVCWTCCPMAASVVGESNVGCCVWVHRWEVGGGHDRVWRNGTPDWCPGNAVARGARGAQRCSPWTRFNPGWTQASPSLGPRNLRSAGRCPVHPVRDLCGQLSGSKGGCGGRR